MKRHEATHRCAAGPECSHDVKCSRCGNDAECSVEARGITEPWCENCFEIANLRECNCLECCAQADAMEESA
jgi:hypothetical protein